MTKLQELAERYFGDFQTEQGKNDYELVHWAVARIAELEAENKQLLAAKKDYTELLVYSDGLRYGDGWGITAGSVLVLAAANWLVEVGLWEQVPDSPNATSSIYVYRCKAAEREGGK